MNSESMDSSIAPPSNAVNMQSTAPTNLSTNDPPNDSTPNQTSPGVSSWGWNLKIPQPFTKGLDESPTENSAKSAFARFTSGLALRSSPRDQTLDQVSEPDVDGASSGSNFFGNLTKGLVDSSKTAVRAVQLKARHVVSQNKRRFQEDGYDLDMTYITENIIAMGFPAGDMSSGFFGYVEGLYRNQMEEVISFLESHHKGKYKVYNLCSERLYDASLFEGKVASFPFDDHNCPPLHLVTSFCQSAYAWLKEDIENVVVVHCKAGMARTGLMISSLLLYLKFFPTAEESIDHYNQKRCFDGKGLVLPSQIRYVKYFERVLTYFNGENQPGRRCMLRGFRLHRCPYWIRPHITVSDHNGVLFSTKKHPRTKDLTPEDFWFTAPKKGIIVFAMPGDPGLTELAGDFKVQFHDGQGDFYFWLNTTMIENRMILNTGDMDGFDKRKLPSPGFQVEVVLVELNDTPTSPQPATATQNPDNSTTAPPAVSLKETSSSPSSTHQDSQTKPQDKDDVFSDDEGDKSDTKTSQKAHTTSADTSAESTSPPQINTCSDGKVEDVTRLAEKTSLGDKHSTLASADDESRRESTSEYDGRSSTQSEFKVMAADASVFTFGDDEEDYESD